jgi:hypothetical protein
MFFLSQRKAWVRTGITLRKKDMSDPSKKDPVPVFVIKRLGGQAPEFDMPVEIRKLDGTPASLTFRCKALKKTEWAAIKDARQREAIEATLNEKEAAESAAVEPPAAEPQEKAPKRGARKPKAGTEAEAPATAKALREVVLRTFDENSLLSAVKDALKTDASLVEKFAIGWDLEDEFNTANLEALENEFAGSLEAAINAYNQAVFRGQVKNSKP